jgi:triphosphoribosyl-dephospho-CoA synthase
MAKLTSVNRAPQPAATHLSNLAVQALLDEAELTPKPALVDGRGSGAHHDLSLALLRRSAETLRPYFEQVALSSFRRRATIALREELGTIGLLAERSMVKVTGGANTHRGAIWSLGLLIAATAMGHRSVSTIAAAAGELAQLPDRQDLVRDSNGSKASRVYKVRGARGQAQAGFPHVLLVGLPILNQSRKNNVSEVGARLDALLAMMMTLDDTCLLHRGGMVALQTAQAGAAAVLAAGGADTLEGRRRLLQLDRDLIALNASPGGSADLLAATLFLDSVV